MDWVPLHVHSQYSILDSTASVYSLAKEAQKQGIKSMALTDSGNMHGAVDFYKACKSHDVKPIIGCELRVAPFSRFDKKKNMKKAAGYPIILLAKNAVGYRHLCKLSSAAFTEGFYYTPRIDMELLNTFSEGLIALIGGSESDVSQLF